MPRDVYAALKADRGSGEAKQMLQHRLQRGFGQGTEEVPKPGKWNDGELRQLRLSGLPAHPT